MADKGTDSRLKLTITEVKERQSVGDKGAVKLGFFATEGDGKALSYFTFSTRLFETIEGGKGKEIDCDVNVSTREWERDGDIQHFTDRKVTQIYVDGQPVGGQKRQWNQDSPETRASIEAQKRADITAQLWIADKFNEKSPEVIKLRKWLMRDATPEAKASPKQKIEDMTAPEELIFPEESGGETVIGDLKNLPINNLGDLFNACLHRFKMSQAAVLKELGGIAKEQIGDPQDAWSQIVEAKS